MDNHHYNLLTQLAEEQKSLWRIKHMYKKDAKGCRMCQEFWREVEDCKEEDAKTLAALLKKHL